MQQIKHSKQDFFQHIQGVTMLLNNDDKNFFRDNVHIYRFYFVTSVVPSIVSIILIYFIPDHVILTALVTGMAVNKTMQLEAVVTIDQDVL